MDATKVSVKLFATRALEQDLESYIPIFHRWIREGSLEEMMIDVADYRHVPRGPGILLVGHAFDLSVDQGEDRPGLTYLRKRDLPAGQPLVADALARAIKAAQVLDADVEAVGPKGFSTAEILFTLPDRLHVQNDDASFEKVLPAIREALEAAGLGASYAISREGDPREPLTIRAVAS